MLVIYQESLHGARSTELKVIILFGENPVLDSVTQMGDKKIKIWVQVVLHDQAFQMQQNYILYMILNMTGGTLCVYVTLE